MNATLSQVYMQRWNVGQNDLILYLESLASNTDSGAKENLFSPRLKFF
jgi:hypothetical protein